MTTAVDLNADLGELPGLGGAEIDRALLEVVTSASVACGGHAGSPESVRRVSRAAADAGVAIGAHVSYADREGFGRRRLDVAPDDLVEQLGQQLRTLEEAAHEAGTRVTYLKPHGALYHAVIDDPRHAGAVIDAVLTHQESTGVALALLGAPGSALLTLASAAGLPTVDEAFADRGYRADGGLVPRGEPGALVTDPAAVVARVTRLAVSGTVLADDGRSVTVSGRSICLHSDTPGAVRLARRIRDGLWAAHVTVAAFAPPPRRP